MKPEAQKTSVKCCVCSHLGARIPFVIRFWILALTLAYASLGVSAPTDLLARPWFQARTAHFNIYSCGDTREVAKVAARLEQFRGAYSILAGAQAVASPPIIVIAFPDHASMKPFLPLYQGKPVSAAAFFHRGSDENFIALYLSGAGSTSLENVFHEYTHLLLRHNQRFWPVWLSEGMAEIYSTFEVVPNGGVRIGAPHERYLEILSAKPLLPLGQLLAVGHDSADYNERDRQGIFYAESWLLTHYLMLGEPVNKPRFSEFSTLLRQGESPEQAFTNAFKVSLRQMESQLHRYLEKGQYQTLTFALNGSLPASVPLATRVASPAEITFRLGDMLLRVNRADEAREWFARGEKIAPKSPLPHEGFGLLASLHTEPAEAIQQFREAAALGQIGFLSHYAWAKSLLETASESPNTFSKVRQPKMAAEIRSELEKSIAPMPDFGPAHELLGIFLMLQGEDLLLAETHLQRAIDLEPENQSYLLYLAQLQWRRNNLEAARHTLEPLRLSYADPRLRAHAEELLREMAKTGK
jgi:tetratricopeptide (TPR) repeat protein